MKKIVPLIVFALFSAPSFCEVNEAMIDFVMQIMKEDGDITSLSECTGAKPDKLESAMRVAMKNCMGKEYMEDDVARRQCGIPYLAKGTGVKKSKFEACEEELNRGEKLQTETVYEIEDNIELLVVEQEKYFSKDELSHEDEKRLSEIDEQIDRLNNQLAMLHENENENENEKAMAQIFQQIGDNAPNEEQIAALDRLQAAQHKEDLPQADQMLNVFSKGESSNLEQITLPIYKDSKVLMHMGFENIMKWDGKKVKTLPAATFSSSAEIKKIVKFYEKQLPSFELMETTDGFLFMEKMPPNFSMLHHIKEYTSTPHVNISKANDQFGQLPVGTTVVIEIAYRL